MAYKVPNLDEMLGFLVAQFKGAAAGSQHRLALHVFGGSS
jgi:hypothetical protein